MFKKVFKTLKDYETIENNSQRLNKGYTETKIFTNLYKILYK